LSDLRWTHPQPCLWDWRNRRKHFAVKELRLPRKRGAVKSKHVPRPNYKRLPRSDYRRHLPRSSYPASLGHGPCQYVLRPRERESLTQ
jgi:hypothetical protein